MVIRFNSSKLSMNYLLMQTNNNACLHCNSKGVQWLSGRVLDSRPMRHPRYCVVSLGKTYNLPSLSTGPTQEDQSRHN